VPKGGVGRPCRNSHTSHADRQNPAMVAASPHQTPGLDVPANVRGSFDTRLPPWLGSTDLEAVDRIQETPPTPALPEAVAQIEEVFQTPACLLRALRTRCQRYQQPECRSDLHPRVVSVKWNSSACQSEIEMSPFSDPALTKPLLEAYHAGHIPGMPRIRLMRSLIAVGCTDICVAAISDFQLLPPARIRR